MRKIFTIIILTLLTNNLFAEWGLWDSDRSYIVLNVKGSSNTYSLWNGGTGTFQGTNLGTFTNGDVLEINNFDVKTWKDGPSDVTGCEYFYVIYETGSRPSSPSFISLGGGFLQDLGNGNQKWGGSGLAVDLLVGLDANKNYTLEIYGKVDGTNPNESKYDNNNNSSTNYTATFITDAGLPVELTTFTAFAKEKEVVLNWQTATEVNNYGFYVERLAKSLNSDVNTEQNNAAWKSLGFVEGHGNSNSPKTYSYSDNSVNSGKYLYRLKQVDNDGSFEYSKVVEVNLEIPKEFELAQNYPNPFNPTTTIKFSLPEASNITLTVYNAIGEKITELLKGKMNAGYHSVEFGASSVSKQINSGVYIYSLQTPQKVISRKMILMK